MNAPQGERSPESNPNLPTPDTSPEIQLPNVERGAQSAPERASEQSNQAQAVPVSLPTPVVTEDDTQVQSQVDDNPAVAADEDLIEKEWVDKAKQIIADTRDDPAAREKQVGKLQADYLKKRYGKELGATTE